MIFYKILMNEPKTKFNEHIIGRKQRF